MNAVIPSMSFLTLAAAVAAQGSTWVQVATGGPLSRYLHATAYDAVRGRVVLTGGYRPGSSLGDTWTWDGLAWTPQLLAASPGARLGHAMAFDSSRGRVVMFGGASGSSGVFADTWEWDGTTWHLVDLNGPARIGHSMAFDSVRGRVVLFGGGASGSLYSGTWEWDGTSWSLVSLAGNPPVREAAAMVFDSHRGRSVLYGGWGTNGVRSDVWEWTGSVWLPAGNGPPARFYHAMAYDTHRQRVVVFGGLINNNPTGGEVSETWEWDGLSWQIVSSGGPSARYGHSAAYDVGRRAMVVFGGGIQTATAHLYLGDTWAWGSAGSSVPYGVGCGTPPLTLNPNLAAPPQVGATAQAGLTAVPSPLAFVALGTSNTTFNSFPLPVTLASIGMPGCDLLQSADVVGEAATMTSATTASYSFAIPNNAALVGMHLYLQGWAFAPGANAANIVVSNGLDWQIGY